MVRVAALLGLLSLTLSYADDARADIPTPRYVPPEKYSESIVRDAEKGNLAAVQAALRHDPELTQWQRIKGSALCEAARAGHAEIVRLLLEHHAPIDSTRAAHQFTPLHCAMQKGNADVVRLLLAAKPPLETKTSDGETPLMLAARACNMEVLKLIIDAGAQLETKGKDDKTALCVAIHEGKTACVSELLRRGAATAITAEGIGQLPSRGTPLIGAVDNGDGETVKVLLDGGADPNFSADGSPAIFRAVYHDSPEILKLLLDGKADLNRADNDGMTPVAMAAEAGAMKTLELLIAAKANLTLVDNEGRTPLFRAARNHKKAAAMALLTAGADPMIVSKQGERALEFLLADMNKDAPELKPLLAKYLNKKGLPIKPLPKAPRSQPENAR